MGGTFENVDAFVVQLEQASRASSGETGANRESFESSIKASTRAPRISRRRTSAARLRRVEWRRDQGSRRAASQSIRRRSPRWTLRSTCFCGLLIHPLRRRRQNHSTIQVAKTVHQLRCHAPTSDLASATKAIAQSQAAAQIQAHFLSSGTICEFW